MKKIFNFIILSIIIINCRAQQTNLALNLEKGNVYKQITDSKMTIIQDFGGQKMNIEMLLKGGMSYLVKKVNKDEYIMEVKYDSLSMSMQLPQGKMKFSSEDKNEQNIFSSLLAEMKKFPFEITMAKTGKVIKVKNMDAMFDSMFKKFSDIPENQLAQIKAQLKNAYGEKAFKGNIEMITAIYPNHPIRKGESWEINTKLESGMSGNINSTYNLTEKSSDYYIIVGKSIITTEDKDAYVQTNGMPTKYDMKGKMSSNIKVDKKSGWIIEAKINQNIEGTVYIKNNPEMEEGMKIPMIMNNKMIFTNK